MYMAAKVATIPTIYPIKAVVKQVKANYFKVFTFLDMLRSTSNLRHKATNKPGITISPRPNILNFYSPSLLRKGNSSLIGISSFFATVTMTSVPQTQKISQKNKNHNNKNPTLKLAKSIFLSAIIENRIPNILFKIQYFVTQYNKTGIDTNMVHIMVAFVRSKSSISSTDFINLGGLTCLIIFLKSSGNGRFDQSRLLEDITVAMLN